MRMREGLANGLCLLLLGLGVWTVCDPLIFQRDYDLDLSTPLARTTIRAIIGGSEIGFAFAILLRRKLAISSMAILRIGACVFSGIVLARLVSITLEQSYAATSWIELAAEAIVAVILWFASRPD